MQHEERGGYGLSLRTGNGIQRRCVVTLTNTWLYMVMQCAPMKY